MFPYYTTKPLFITLPAHYASQRDMIRAVNNRNPVQKRGTTK